MAAAAMMLPVYWVQRSSSALNKALCSTGTLEVDCSEDEIAQASRNLTPLQRFSHGLPAWKERGMAHRDIVAIGTSAGGVEALRYLAKRLPHDLQASVFVTIHLSSRFGSALDKILANAGPLPAGFASHGEVVAKSRIYIAPPERHLIIDGDRLWLGS
jgi:chemotaxis response regulator CheB